MTGFYQWLRANGDVFIAVSLAGCLLVRNWTLATLSIYLGLVILSSLFLSIWHSIQNYNSPFFKTLTGIYYNIKILFLVPFFFLLIYHDDGISGMETPLKGLLVAYVIVMNVDRLRWPVIVRGAAIGAIAALAVGMLKVGIYAGDRSAAPTNLVRFGMIAMALGTVCAVGVVQARDDRVTVALSFAGLLAGIAAALLSGSRGALLALPFIILLLAPVLWRQSRRVFVTVALILALFIGGLLAADVGKMTTRIGYVYSNVSAMLFGGTDQGDRSVGDRTKLLVLAFKLLEEHPLLGVGSSGWNEGVDKLYNSPEHSEQVAYLYNQAHNQYADDLAKGGIVRFLLGFVLLFLPLYLFLKCEPYSGEPGSQFALAGVTVSAAFMIFCLTESLMILSLSTVVHSVLMFSLLKACDQVRREAAASIPGGIEARAAT